MADIDTLPQLMSIDQLADRLGTTVPHIRRLVADKRIPYIKVGKLVRFDADEITRWLHSHRSPEANRDHGA